MPIHATYGLPSLPKLQVVRLEENIAEKISRLNRTTTARDLYGLAWLVIHQRDSGDLDTDLIRRMVVLKIWVDANGVTAGSMRGRAGHEPRPFDPDHWLRTRALEEVDLADIGALAVPTPSLADLNATIQAQYRFLRELEPRRATARRDTRAGPPPRPAAAQRAPRSAPCLAWSLLTEPGRRDRYSAPALVIPELTSRGSSPKFEDPTTNATKAQQRRQRLRSHDGHEVILPPVYRANPPSLTGRSAATNALRVGYTARDRILNSRSARGDMTHLADRGRSGRLSCPACAASADRHQAGGSHNPFSRSPDRLRTRGASRTRPQPTRLVARF